MLRHIILNGGKRIRPAMLLLAGKFYNYDLTVLLPMAVAVELLHTATLVHDDAIDKATVRRGQPTINRVWDEEKAILLGDYLLAKATKCASETQSLEAVELFAQAMMTVSSGEINQSFNAFNLNQTFDEYLKRIACKTASLFVLAMESGAILSQATPKAVKALKDYSYHLGIAFQIVDDILDYVGTEDELGKPIGSDLAQGTLTLPAMLLHQHYAEKNLVEKVFANQERDKYMQLAIEQIKNSSIPDECYSLANDYAQKAINFLDDLPRDTPHAALVKLARYIIERRR
jgi:geranylgeranyl pyrophosphate synthase